MPKLKLEPKRTTFVVVQHRPFGSSAWCDMDHLPKSVSMEVAVGRKQAHEKRYAALGRRNYEFRIIQRTETTL